MRKQSLNSAKLISYPQMQLQLRGRFVVIEGADGSGKDTQVGLLMDLLKKENINFQMLHFPRYLDNEYGRLVTKYLKGDFGSVYEVDPYLASLPYANDRLLAKPLIEKWLNNQNLVLANRYMASNLAHMSAKLPKEERQHFIDWLSSLEYNINCIPRADLTIFLYVPADFGTKNVGKRGSMVDLGGKRKDIHEDNLQYQHDVNDTFLHMAENDPTWIIIDCIKDNKMKSREEIHQEILKTLLERGILK